VILFDHSGFYSEESLKELQRNAAINIVEVFKANEPTYPVNRIA